jgi:hypothetical protein
VRNEHTALDRSNVSPQLKMRFLWERQRTKLYSLPCVIEAVSFRTDLPTDPMLNSLFGILVILHIITAAAWFGLGLRVAGRARKATELGGEGGAALATDGYSSVWQMNIFIVLTLIFSLSAFVAGGHFDAYGPVYHTSVTLIVLLTLDQLFVIRPGWNALQTAVAGSGGVDADAAESARKKVAIGTGVGHLLWLVILVLMLWNRYLAAYL